MSRLRQDLFVDSVAAANPKVPMLPVSVVATRRPTRRKDNRNEHCQT